MDDDLPDISVNCMENDSQEFEIPNADAVASQRQHEKHQEIEIKKYQAEIAETQSCSEGSENEITSCLEMLRVEIPIVTIPHENPGLNIAALNRAVVLKPFDEVRRSFVSIFLDFISDYSKENASESVLTLYLDSLQNVTREDDSLTHEDIHCQVVILSLLLQWNKNTNKLPQMVIREYLYSMLDDVGANLLSHDLLKRIAHHLLEIFKNHHNRLYLTQSFHNTYLNPQNLTTTHLNTYKITFLLARGCLTSIIGFYDMTYNFDNSFDMTEMSNIVTDGHKWKLLTPYEMYIALMFVNTLLSFAVVRSFDSQSESVDLVSLRELLATLNSLKSSKGTTDNDYWKVDALIEKTCLLWQEKRAMNCITSK